jgi:hypothetical protein
MYVETGNFIWNVSSISCISDNSENMGLLFKIRGDCRVQQDTDPRMAALAKASNNCK